MSFGTKLKLLRTQHKLDQDKMSRRLKVSQPVYSRYENDEKAVDVNDPFVNRIAEEFDIPAQWLFEEMSNNLNFDNAEITNTQKYSENYYTIPKDFMEAFLNQQQILSRMLTKFI